MNFGVIETWWYRKRQITDSLRLKRPNENCFIGDRRPDQCNTGIRPAIGAAPTRHPPRPAHARPPAGETVAQFWRARDDASAARHSPRLHPPKSEPAPSPTPLAGETYGPPPAAAPSEFLLHPYGIPRTGIVLVST